MQLICGAAEHPEIFLRAVLHAGKRATLEPLAVPQAMAATEGSKMYLGQPAETQAVAATEGSEVYLGTNGSAAGHGSHSAF